MLKQRNVLGNLVEDANISNNSLTLLPRLLLLYWKPDVCISINLCGFTSNSGFHQTIHMQHQMPIDKKKIHMWRTRKMWSREILFIHCKCKQNFQVAFAYYTRWGGVKLNNQQTKFGSFTYLFVFQIFRFAFSSPLLFFFFFKHFSFEFMRLNSFIVFSQAQTHLWFMIES